MIKVTIIITGLNIGGAEVMLINLLERLSADFTPEVISLTDIGEIGKCIQNIRIPVEALGMSRTVPNPLLLLRLVRLLRHSQPDIVHTWMYHADLIGGLAARMARVPNVIWSIHNSNLSEEQTKITTRLVARLCAILSAKIPDRILACSQISRKIHTEIGYKNDKFVVIENGIDLEVFKPSLDSRESVRMELGIEPDTPLIGMIARFDPQKNHTGFFKGVGLLHQKRPDFHYLLAGSGVDDNNPILRQSIEEARVSHVTHLLGARKDIPRLMASLDVLVSASAYGEAFPLVLGEAMASSIPCVVTDVGDSAYIVGDTGRVVAPGDMKGLGNAVEEILSLLPHERQLLGKRARQRIEQYFELTHIVDRYESLYKSLL
jgi:glycosyltransferase involved in cell wall biosynthesis